jgi:(3,5-dihydroxyphenyl)acetyl-CoA 1,2-dioxygenase
MKRGESLSRGRLQDWLRREPTEWRLLDADIEVLSAYVAMGESMLCELSPKPSRDTEQRQVADDVHASCRRVRMGFMHAHAEALYARLTSNLSAYLRIDELVARAADVVPGLLPTLRQLQKELACDAQGDKEGREIDQGIFLSGILHTPSSGLHLMDAMLRPTRKAQALLAEFNARGQLDFTTVRLERRGAAAHLTLQNNACLNAEDNVLVDDLETAVDLALLDDSVQVGVLRGGVMTHPRYAGRRVFCAGVNLKHLQQGKISYLDFMLRRELGFIHKMMRGLSSNGAGLRLNRLGCAKPWIAAVDTFAIGGGTQMLLVADKIIAESGAYLSLPAGQEGFVPGLANLRLARYTGPRLAYQLILSGRKIHTRDPEARLLIDEVVSSEEMDAAVERAVAEFAAPSVRTNRQMLRLAEEPIDELRTYLGHFAYEQARRLYDDDVTCKVFKPATQVALH